MTPGEVIVDGVSKRYRHTSGFAERRLLPRPGRGVVWGLRDVSLTVAPGEMFGLLGANGGGKSTLLRLVAGITGPTRGTIETGGRVAGILSLGDGFHPLLTGRENAITGAMLAGMSRREADERLDEILDFSDLGAAVDDPMRTYSSGMIVRLAYSVAAHVAADIVLIDEALAVGDLAFSSKCHAHLDELREAGTTILIASHDLAALRARCDRVAWIGGGRLMAQGEPDLVIDRYETASHAATIAHTSDTRLAAGRLGAGEVEVEILALTTRDGRPADVLASGSPLTVALELRGREAVDSLMVSVSIHAENGDTLVDLATEVGPESVREGTTHIALSLDRLDVTPGRYHVSVGTHAAEFARAYDYRWEAAWITVTGGTFSGRLAPPHTWS